MAIALATSTNAFFKVLDTGQSFRVLCNVVVSGSYSTGGEDLSTILADERVKVGSATTQRGTPYAAYAAASNGTLPSITTVPAQNPLKLKFFTAPGTELGAGAYAAAYTGEVLRLDIEFAKSGSMARTTF
jgi:hypothetical protein